MGEFINCTRTHFQEGTNQIKGARGFINNTLTNFQEGANQIQGGRKKCLHPSVSGEQTWDEWGHNTSVLTVQRKLAAIVCMLLV